MKTEFAHRIEKAGQVIFGLTQKGELFFDRFQIAKVPKNVDFEKLMLALKDDNELNKMVDEYFKMKEEAKELEEEEKKLSRQIDLEILDSIILNIEMFNSEVFCDGVTKEEVKDQVIYRGKNFILSTTNKDIDFTCYVKKVDEEIAKVDSNVLLEINHDEESIGIFFNHYLVYVTPAFKLNAILSYIQDLIFLDELPRFIAHLKKLHKIIDKEAEQVDLYTKIRKHVLKTIKSLSAHSQS